MQIVDFVDGCLVVSYPRDFPQSRKRMLRKSSKDRHWWKRYRNKRIPKNRYSQPTRGNPFLVMAELRILKRMKAARMRDRE